MSASTNNSTGSSIELPSELEPVAVVLREWASTRHFILRIYVYGSRLKQTHRPDSDLDVAMEFEPAGIDLDCFTTWVGDAKKWRRQLQPLLPAVLHLEWHDTNGKTPHVSQWLRDASCVVYERESDPRQCVTR